jgi:hypothetical protein
MINDLEKAYFYNNKELNESLNAENSNIYTVYLLLNKIKLSLQTMQ